MRVTFGLVPGSPTRGWVSYPEYAGAFLIAPRSSLSAVRCRAGAALLVRHGQDPDKTLDPVREQVAVEPFTADDALSAARFLPQTAQKGLSLGD